MVSIPRWPEIGAGGAVDAAGIAVSAAVGADGAMSAAAIPVDGERHC
ncbi:hypothetical protein [Nocardia brasiliensis]|nr:hypothetical protein [Nocardia brasiliensis]